MILGIDASNIRGGGGTTHLLEILDCTDPEIYGIKKILIWSGSETLKQIKDKPYIIKKEIRMLDRSLFFRICWQVLHFDRILKKECDIMLCVGGLYFGSFKPYISMSRNMLIFDDIERNRYGFGYTKLRYIILRLLQKRSFINANGVIFVSNYAKRFISERLGFKIKNSTVIYHGISGRFTNLPKPQKDIKTYSFEEPFRFLYISSIDVYKHQWNIAEAVANLRDSGIPIEITLAGWVHKKPFERFNKVVETRDREKKFIKFLGPVPYDQLPELYRKADAFVYGSTCENMPNILLEAMSAGLPVACSDFQPMPEILGENGIFFNPESVPDIERALKLLVSDSELRNLIAFAAYFRAKEFSWEKCSAETFGFISRVYSDSFINAENDRVGGKEPKINTEE